MTIITLTKTDVDLHNSMPVMERIQGALKVVEDRFEREVTSVIWTRDSPDVVRVQHPSTSDQLEGVISWKYISETRTVSVVVHLHFNGLVGSGESVVPHLRIATELVGAVQQFMTALADELGADFTKREV